MASPRPLFTTILCRRGTAIEFLRSSSSAGGAISFSNLERSRISFFALCRATCATCPCCLLLFFLLPSQLLSLTVSEEPRALSLVGCFSVSKNFRCCQLKSRDSHYYPASCTTACTPYFAIATDFVSDAHRARRTSCTFEIDTRLSCSAMPPWMLRCGVRPHVLLHHHYVLDQGLGVRRKHTEHSSLLPFITAGNDLRRLRCQLECVAYSLLLA